MICISGELDLFEALLLAVYLVLSLLLRGDEELVLSGAVPLGHGLLLGRLRNLASLVHEALELRRLEKPKKVQ
jgi:hypothetical protein